MTRIPVIITPQAAPSVPTLNGTLENEAQHQKEGKGLRRPYSGV